MSTSTIILFTIVVCSNAFELVEIRSDREVTAQELLGNWVTVAAIDPTLDQHMELCTIHEISMGINNHTVNITKEIGTNENIHRYEGTASVANHGMYHVYSDGNRVHKIVYGIDSYDNGDGLILQDKSDGIKHYIWKAPLSGTNLAESKAVLERKSAALGVNITYFDLQNCH